MKPVAFIDANVLVPYNLMSLLLTMADHGLMEVRWSEKVLGETRRALIDQIGVEPDLADRRIAAMSRAFPEALVDASGVTEENVGTARAWLSMQVAHDLAAERAMGVPKVRRLDPVA